MRSFVVCFLLIDHRYLSDSVDAPTRTVVFFSCRWTRHVVAGSCFRKLNVRLITFDWYYLHNHIIIPFCCWFRCIALSPRHIGTIPILFVLLMRTSMVRRDTRWSTCWIRWRSVAGRTSRSRYRLARTQKTALTLLRWSSVFRCLWRMWCHHDEWLCGWETWR